MSKIVLYPADGYDFDAADVAAYLAGLTSGVFSSAEDFPVTAADGLKVTVGAGRGWVHPSRFTGYSITKREADTLTLPLADPSLPRIDMKQMWLRIIRTSGGYSYPDKASMAIILSGYLQI